MKNDHPLQEWLERYRQGEIDRKALEGAIFLHLKSNPKRFKLSAWNEEDRIDILLRLYPRISRSIDTYRDRGSSFDGYVSALVHWGVRSLRREDSIRGAMERQCWLNSDGLYIREPEHLYHHQDPAPFLQKPKNPRQVLMLALKCCPYMSEDFAGRVARAVNLEPETLAALMDRLRDLDGKRAARARLLEERAGAYWYRRLALQAKLREATGDEREEIQRSLDDLNRRMENARSRLRRCRDAPTNKEIAAVLGIPKGTVDACLHFIKKKASSLHGGEADEV